MLPRLKRPLLTLFTSKTCSLCVTAKEALDRVHQKVPFSFQELDINEPKNREFRDLYRFDIPVLHLNDKKVMQHRIDTEKLEEMLREATGRP